MQILLSILSCNRIAVAVKTLLQVESKALQLEKCVRFAMVLNVMQPLFHVDTISLVSTVLRDATVVRYAEHLSKIL